MKYAIIFAAALSVASARPTRHHLFRREVPQEHSHEQFLRTVNTNLKIDNPNNIQDAVFGLLGNAAASAGQGNIADTGTSINDHCIINALLIHCRLPPAGHR